MPREVHIGSPVQGVTVGGVRVPVGAGVAGGGDITRVDLGAGYEQTGQGMATIRELVTRPLLVDVHDPEQCAAAVPYADGVLARVRLMDTARVAEAVSRRGVPVVIRREPETSTDDWLAAAQACLADGHEVILCEGGRAPGKGGAERAWAPQLGLLRSVRERIDLPVLVDVSAAPELTAAAVAAGAHGILLGEDASATDAAHAVELATTLAPFGRDLEPRTLEAARQAIDQVDACLANLLERRAALADLVQRLKPVGGFAGRDPVRERDLVAAMARRAPRLGLDRVRRIMAVVIEAGLELAESDPAEDDDGGVGAKARHPGDRSEHTRGVENRNVPRAS